jgi:iron(III) transport system ATP-binding protein
MRDVTFDGVGRCFADGTWGVRDVSFTAPAGQLTTLLGPSGSGKSTLLRIAAGFESASRGRVLLDDEDVTHLPPDARGLTLLFQSGALFPHLDVLGNVAYGLKATDVAKAPAARRAREALELVGLQGLEHAACHELSGGQQQRVSLARALVLQPSVLLLDEPLSNLDDRLRRQMRDEIRQLQRRLGLTVIYVTHDEAEAMALSDQLVIVNEGRLMQAGTPREVYERPKCEFVAAFMGDAGMFDVRIGPDGHARLGGVSVRPWTGDHPAGTLLRLMVRPEAWRILPVGHRRETEGLPARVVRGAYLGHGAEYVVDTELGELLVKTWHAESLHQPGAPVSLALSEQGVTVMSTSRPSAA